MSAGMLPRAVQAAQWEALRGRWDGVLLMLLLRLISGGRSRKLLPDDFINYKRKERERERTKNKDQIHFLEPKAIRLFSPKTHSCSLL